VAPPIPSTNPRTRAASITVSISVKNAVAKLTPVSETIKDRGDWLRSQITTQQAALDKIASGDYSARREGLDQLSKIMPFLLMGDYSLTEVILYLKAKIAAAEQVSKEQTGGSGAQPQEQEEEKVELERHNTAVSKPLTSALEENP